MSNKRQKKTKKQKVQKLKVDEQQTAVNSVEGQVVKEGDNTPSGATIDLSEKVPTIDIQKEGAVSLSVCMIVKDEEKDLGNILDDLKKFADEIIVVDTGSKDKTKEIAENLGAKVFDFEWINDFSAARNFSLKHATKDYILWVDADDRISEIDGNKIREVINNQPEKLVYRIQVISDGEKGKSYFFQTRLFPRDDRIVFVNKIHEDISQSVKKHGFKYTNTNILIKHTGYSTAKAVRDKIKRNIVYLKELLIEDPTSISNRFTYAHSLREMGDFGGALKQYKIIISDERNKNIQSEIYYHSFSDYIRCIFSAGHITEAVRVFQSIEKSVPGSLKLYSLAGEMFLKIEQYRAAEIYFVKALVFEDKVNSISTNFKSFRMFCARNLLIAIEKRYG